MADDTVNPPETTTAERELRIDIWPDEVVMFEGTAAQLTAEGLIPNDFEWPRGAAQKCWSANGFDYTLRRTRPARHKGPMASWLVLDNWHLSLRVVGRDYRWTAHRRLERKTEELRAECHRLTPAGSRQWAAEFNRYWRAERDKQFQAFKALVPGLTRPKRGRKPKEDKGAPQCS